MDTNQEPQKNAVIQNNGRFSSTNPVLDSLPSARERKEDSNPPESSTSPPSNNNSLRRKSETKSIKDKSRKNTVVNIVLVEAKGLPDVPDDGLSHRIHCKFRLGSQTYRSKTAASTRHPEWRERFKLSLAGDQLLYISLWDKGKQKNFMGSCVLDLSIREIERTHDIWQKLEEGFGSIHLSVTICPISNLDLGGCEPNFEDLRYKYAFYNLPTDLEIVGQLHVKVIAAKGLYGKPSPYCILELDNEMIQTPKVYCTSEPVWNKSYLFNIFDVTSVLEVKVLDSSFNSLFTDFLGRVTIPLLRIVDGEARWYALKDSSKRDIAKGNCPRVKLEMSLIWNPLTASFKLFRPKQVKYIEKEPKFDLALVYKNIKFIKDTFETLIVINEIFKRLFEWEDQELAFISVTIWLIFWYYFEAWMGPLLIVALFPVCYFYDKWQNNDLSSTEEEILDSRYTEVSHHEETITDKIVGLPEMTFTITRCIEYMVSVAERLYNLVTFKVPFLSYLAITLLITGAGALYLIPFKFLMMSFGLYKFLRKRIHPNRVLNNDFLDFISRIPDYKILKDWKELTVPEPQQYKNSN